MQVLLPPADDEHHATNTPPPPNEGFPALWRCNSYKQSLTSVVLETAQSQHPPHPPLQEGAGPFIEPRVRPISGKMGLTRLNKTAPITAAS